MMSEFEKISLIKRVQNSSDSEALEILIITHTNLINKVAFKYNGSKSIDIKDLIQEGYVGLIRSIKIFPLSGDFNAFSYVIIRNSVVNFIRRQNIRNHCRSNFDALLEEVSFSQKLPEAGLKPFLFKHINKTLTPLEILLIKWKFGLDNENWLTTEEISEITSFSARRINQIIQVALKKLKYSIENESDSNNKNLFLGQ